MNQLDLFSRLVGRVYDAAVTPTTWVDVLQALTEHFGAVGAQLVYADHRRKELTINVSFGFSEEVVATHERLAFEDPMTPLIMENQNAVVRHSIDALPEAQKNTRFVQEALLKHNIGERVGFISEIREQETLGLGVLLARDRPPMAAEQLDFLRALQPHLVRAISMHKEIAELKTDKARHQQLMDSLPLGVMMLDAKRRVLFENMAAAKITADRRYFTRFGGVLSATLAADAKALRAAVGAHAARGPAESTALRIEGEGEGEAMFVTVLGASPDRPPYDIMISPERAAMLYIFDPRIRIETSHQLLSRLFGLTNAEARAMQHLVQGATINEIAESCDLSVETVRTYIKRILQKTGGRRQADVIRIVANSPAWIRQNETIPLER